MPLVGSGRKVSESKDSADGTGPCPTNAEESKLAGMEANSWQLNHASVDGHGWRKAQRFSVRAEAQNEQCNCDGDKWFVARLSDTANRAEASDPNRL